MNIPISSALRLKQLKRSSKKSIRFPKNLSGSPKTKSSKIKNNKLKNNPTLKMRGKTDLKIKSTTNLSKNRQKWINCQLKSRQSKSKRKNSNFKLIKHKIGAELMRKIQYVDKKIMRKKLKTRSIKHRPTKGNNFLGRENSTSIMGSNQRAISGKRLRQISKNLRSKSKQTNLWGSNGMSELGKKLQRKKSSKNCKKLRSSQKKKNFSNLVNQRSLFKQFRSKKSSKSVKRDFYKTFSKQVNKKSGHLFKDQKLKELILEKEKDQMTVFESFEQKNISDIDLFESFSHAKTVKTTDRASQVELQNCSEFRNKSMLSSNLHQIEEGLKVYGKLRGMFREKKLSLPTNRNTGVVNFLDLKVEGIQKHIDNKLKTLEVIKKHKSNFKNYITHIKDKISKIEKKFLFFIENKEDHLMKLLKRHSLNRNMAMLSAEIFSVTPNTLHQTQTENLKYFLQDASLDSEKTSLSLHFWERRIKKFKKHINKIGDWFFETFSMLSGLSCEKSNSYNPFNIIFNRESQISIIKHKSRKSSITRVSSQLQGGLTFHPRKSQTKNITNCLYKDLRVGTSASYNGRDFSRILPNLKNTSIFKNSSKALPMQPNMKLVKPNNLIDSRFSSYLNDIDRKKKSIRGQSQKQKTEHLQESQIFRHVKFPSARFFYTGKKMNLFLDESLTNEETSKVPERTCKFESEKQMENDQAFGGEYLLSKERKKTFKVKSEIMSSMNKDNVFI
jgi:hypothetical protein